MTEISGVFLTHTASRLDPSSYSRWLLFWILTQTRLLNAVEINTMIHVIWGFVLLCLCLCVFRSFNKCFLNVLQPTSDAILNESAIPVLVFVPMVTMIQPHFQGAQTLKLSCRCKSRCVLNQGGLFLVVCKSQLVAIVQHASISIKQSWIASKEEERLYAGSYLQAQLLIQACCSFDHIMAFYVPMGQEDLFTHILWWKH